MVSTVPEATKQTMEGDLIPILLHADPKAIGIVLPAAIDWFEPLGALGRFNPKYR